MQRKAWAIGWLPWALLAFGCSSSDDDRTQPDGPHESPTVLATSLTDPRELVHDASSLFFLADVSGGSHAVFSLSDQGGAPAQLAPTTGRSLALANQALYWLSANGLDTMPESGGPTSLVSGEVPSDYTWDVQDLTADATAVYWTEQDSGGAGRVRAFVLGSTGATELAPAKGSATLLVVDAVAVYWLATGEVHRVPKPGGQPETLATFSAAASGLAVDDEYVYWTSLDNAGSVRRVSKSGGDMTILVEGIDHPRSVAVDGTHVYFTAQGEGTVNRVAKSSGALERLAIGQAGPLALALSDDRVFWANVDDGTISSVHK